MPEFKLLGYEDFYAVREYFLADNEERRIQNLDLICDQLFGTTYMWRDYYKTEYAVIGDCLVLQVSMGGTEMYTVPMGGDVAASLRLLGDYVHSMGKTLYFCFVAECDLHYFNDTFDIVFSSEERDWFDYVYDKSSLTDFAGKRYHGQKNFVNRFKKAHPDFSFVPVDPSNAAIALDFTKDWFCKFSDHSPMSDAEEKAIIELLDDWDSYDMTGGFITAGGNITGFTAGEVVGDTVFVHIEKADHTIPGAYQILGSEYLRSISDSGVTYVNREEDMGIPGLRTSKTALHPVKLLKKYTLYCC